MEQFYYLSDEFLKAHFNIPELGNYVLVQYRDGDQFFVSLGRKIKALRKQYRLFVDLRRGKICNPYADETHGLSCQILGRAVVTSILKSCTKTVGAAKTFAAIFLWMIRHISSAGISMPGILTLTPNYWNQEYCIIQVIVFLSDI